MQKLTFFGMMMVACFSATCINAQKKKDTIFLERQFVNDGGHQSYGAIYIDTSRKAAYYKQVIQMRRKKSDDESYKSSLEFLSGKGLPLRKHRIRGLPRVWIPLEWYKNKYYIYDPCDSMGYYRVWITDNAFVDDLGKGPAANKVVSFRKHDAATFSFVLTGMNTKDRPLIIHLVDRRRGIAVFEYPKNGKEKVYRLMIDGNKAKQFPIVVNYCPSVKSKEFNFDKPDFERLIREKH